MTDFTVVGIQEMLNQAKRLGLLPSYRYGTVEAATGTNAAILMVTLDGDEQPSRVFNNVGPLSAGSRVFTVFVPPHGVYAIGAVRTSNKEVVTYINVAGAGLYTPADGIVYAKVEVIGGGGGGGGVATTAAGQSAAASGGASGGYAMKVYSAAELGPFVNYTVGAGGPGATAGANNGSPGGATTFLGLTGPGGPGGIGMGSTVGPNVSAGATPAIGTGGDINLFGGFGQNGIVFGGGVVQQGFGGAAPIYGGIIRGVASAAGGNGGGGLPPAGGGAGGHNFASQGTARSGGTGDPGLIVITEYFF